MNFQTSIIRIWVESEAQIIQEQNCEFTKDSLFRCHADRFEPHFDTSFMTKYSILKVNIKLYKYRQQNIGYILR